MRKALVGLTPATGTIVPSLEVAKAIPGCRFGCQSAAHALSRKRTRILQTSAEAGLSNRVCFQEGGPCIMCTMLHDAEIIVSCCNTHLNIHETLQRSLKSQTTIGSLVNTHDIRGMYQT